jgi:hypothetical protein
LRGEDPGTMRSLFQRSVRYDRCRSWHDWTRSNRSAFAVTMSVAPVSAAIASQRLVWPKTASTRKTSFTAIEKAMLIKLDHAQGAPTKMNGFGNFT